MLLTFHCFKTDFVSKTVDIYRNISTHSTVAYLGSTAQVVSILKEGSDSLNNPIATTKALQQ